MNYRSQLRGWAVDRVIELARVTGEKLGLDELKKQAEILMDFAYVEREDLESTAKELFELVRNARSGESSVDALIGTLEHIKEDRIRQGIDKDESVSEA